VSKKTRRDPASAAAGAALSETQEPREEICATVLAKVAERVERQRAAILSGDPAAVARSFEALMPLLGDLSMLVRAADTDKGRLPEPLRGLARRVRDQIRLNQTLTANGMTIADHFVLCVAEASPMISPAFFSEVA
jgi:hypothetical protein